MLHIVSQASGNCSAADVLTLPPGARRLARRTDGFWQAAEQPAATVAQFAGHINLSPAIVRDDLSGADPEPRPSSAYLCYPVPVLRKVARGDRQRDDELCLAIWALFLQRTQIKTQPV